MDVTVRSSRESPGIEQRRSRFHCGRASAHPLLFIPLIASAPEDSAMDCRKIQLDEGC